MFNEDRLSYTNIIGIDVYLEYRKTRKKVGSLTRDKKSKEFVFTYLRTYLGLNKAIPLGPELPLTKQTHRLKNLFKVFKDRIPSKDNPAYVEYCEAFGLSPSEKDKLILLATIGRRGPSSFVFEPIYKPLVSLEERSQFRKNLGLTIREFAATFEFSSRTVQKLEKGEDTGGESQKRMDTYILFPEVALLDLNLNGGHLLPTKREQALQILESKPTGETIEL